MSKRRQPLPPLTRQESAELGRAEYLNPANKGKSIAQVWTKLNRRNPGGVSHIWKRDFVNGWYAATMIGPDERVAIAPIPELELVRRIEKVEA